MRGPGGKRLFRGWTLIAIMALALIIGTGVSLRIWYDRNLQPVSSSSSLTYFTVEKGASVHQIGVGLKYTNLIRSSQAFETYVRTNELFDKLQAGTYVLSRSMSAPQIVDKMIKGDVAKNLLTILPAKRLDQIQQAFKEAGYAQTQINRAFNPAQYNGHPTLASLPAGVSLEGYLYPDSFQKESDTPAETIVRESLDEMQKYLTQDTVSGFTAQNLSIYDAITLASIVEQETDDPTYQPTVAQVFLSRIRQNIALQSDPTANYAADIAGQPRSLSINSAYNTYLHPGLPPGPIGNVTAQALKAVAHPASTDYLYFVAGDDGKVHFSRTAKEHQDAVAKYCTKQCSQ